MNDRETSCIPRTSFLVSALKKTKTSKKEGKHALDQVSKIQETTRTIKEGRRKWKTQIRIKHLALASFFFYVYSIWSNRQMTETIISG